MSANENALSFPKEAGVKVPRPLTRWTRTAVAIVAAGVIPPAYARTLCTAIADAASGDLLVQDGACAARVTPASTFKIPIALMGYDSGFLKTEHAPTLPFRPGYPAWRPAWRQTTDPARWIEYSVVWYSQQVTKALGQRRFARYLDAFHYGNDDIVGDPGLHNGLTNAWLSSSLKISPLEQVAFLRALIDGQLPVSSHAVEMTSRITRVPEHPAGWAVHGKTGTGAPSLQDGALDDAHAYGWFVGWATKGPRTVVFARLTQDETPHSGAAGPRARDGFIRDLPALLGPNVIGTPPG